MLELQVQAVARVGVELGLELDAVPVERVHVQVGEIALAQRDQVAAGAQVGLGLDGRAVAGDGEAELAVVLVELDLIPVSGIGVGALGQQVSSSASAWASKSACPSAPV